MSRRLSRREEIGQLFAANPVFAWGGLMSIIGTLIGAVRHILAIFLLVLLLSPLVTIAQDEDDEEWIIRNCPAACRTYVYESWEWYAFCWPLPRKCSANPVETLQARTPDSLLAQILDMLRSGKR